MTPATSLSTRTLAALLAFSFAACAPRGAEDPSTTAEDPPAAEDPSTEDVMDQSRAIEEVLADSTTSWMAIPGVEGTGLGACDGEPCIVVYVARRSEEIDRRIPESVEGHPVRIEVTGAFEPRRPKAPS